MRDLTPRQLLAVALIALGALWLLAGLGLLPTALVGRALSWWPLLLIGLGLDLTLPRRRPFRLPFVALAALLALVLALPGPWRNEAVREWAFAEPVGSADRARLVLELGGAPVRLDALDDPEALFSAEVRDTGRVAFDVSGRARKTVELRHRARARAPRADELLWRIGVGTAVPLDLRVDAATGPAVLDLAGTRLERLAFDADAGPAELLLPGGGPLDGEIEGDDGPLSVTLVAGGRGELRIDGGAGPLDVTVRAGADLLLVVEAGDGPIVLDLPDGDPVELHVQDDGAGSLRVAAWLERTEGRGDLGRWRSGTPGEAGLRVVIEDAGPGPIEVR